MKTILIVDDEIPVRELYGTLLSSEGFKIIEAEDAVKTNDILKKEKVDLLLLDIEMPEIDGRILYEVIQLFHKEVKVSVTALVLAGLMIAGCTTTQQGALLGGGTGAGIGAIIGHQKGKTAEGALIGGVAGAALGGLVGDAAAVKFCPKCGKEFTAGVEYCPNDGTGLKFKQK